MAKDSFTKGARLTICLIFSYENSKNLTKNHSQNPGQKTGQKNGHKKNKNRTSELSCWVMEIKVVDDIPPPPQTKQFAKDMVDRLAVNVPGLRQYATDAFGELPQREIEI